MFSAYLLHIPKNRIQHSELPWESIFHALSYILSASFPVPQAFGMDTTHKSELISNSNCPSMESLLKQRCHLCQKEIAGQEGYKQAKDRMTKVKTACSHCQKACCSKHFSVICTDCDVWHPSTAGTLRVCFRLSCLKWPSSILYFFLRLMICYHRTIRKVPPSRITLAKMDKSNLLFLDKNIVECA